MSGNYKLIQHKNCPTSNEKKININSKVHDCSLKDFTLFSKRKDLQQ